MKPGILWVTPSWPENGLRTKRDIAFFLANPAASRRLNVTKE
jgi:hypothetical protein